MKSLFVRGAAVAFALGLLGAACSKSSNTSSSSPTTPPATSASPTEQESSGGTMTIGTEQANDHGTEDVAGKSSREVELDDFYFDPTVLTGTPGQSIELELSNDGSVIHNFSIDEQNIDQDLQPDGKATVTVTFPQSGLVVFFCKFHRTQGMLGALKVS